MKKGREAPSLPTGLRWELVSKNGPKLAKHAACIMNGAMYLHGGTSNISSNQTLDGMFRFDFEKEEWTDFRGPKGAPSLSSHVMQPCGPEHVMVAGGWTGKKRDSEVYTFDTIKKKWRHEKSDNFPAGAGLSSHAIAPLDERGAYVIYGREGSLRTQRKSGSAWVLRGWPAEGFIYTSTPMNCQSRSGHSAVVTSPNQILVIGGRADILVEAHKPPVPARCTPSGVVNRISGRSTIGRAAHAGKKASSNKNKTADNKEQNGRREFVTFGGDNAALIYGGLMFSLTPFAQLPVNDFMLVSEGYQLTLGSADPESNPPRAGAVGCVDGVTGEAYMHGGYCGRTNKVCRELYRLVLDG